jgi:hypothetical protein
MSSRPSRRADAKHDETEPGEVRSRRGVDAAS